MNCETCSLHADVVTKVNRLSYKVTGLFCLTTGVGGLIIWAGLLVWSAKCSAIETQNNLNVHSGRQEEKLKSVNATLVRIERKIGKEHE